VTSHILAEIERVAHRAAILLDGRLLSVHTLGTAGDGSRVRVRLRGADEAAVRASLQGVPGVRLVESLPSQGTYILESDAGAAPAVSALVQAGFAVEEVSSSGTGLEELFLGLTEGAPR
jgi:ABC-2 type transport system ATP-binding protein